MISDARRLVATLAAPYLPRRPTETVLYKLVRQNLESFLAYAREHYDGGLPHYVEQEFRAYLACGDFSRGFTRLSCEACGHDLLVAFLRVRYAMAVPRAASHLPRVSPWCVGGPVAGPRERRASPREGSCQGSAYLPVR